MWSPSYSVVILGLLIAKLLSSASQHDQNYCSDRADGHLQPHHLVATLSKVNLVTIVIFQMFMLLGKSHVDE